MQEFKSKIGSSLGMFFILTLSFLGLLYLLLFLTLDFKLTQITFPAWLTIVMAYGILSYVYAGVTNNDILIFDNRLEIVNKIPLFNKHLSFPLDKIEFVKFRHEWTETFGKNIRPNFIKYIVTQWIAPFVFPTDYKWIQITTDKTYKFCCFGLEMDYYENNEPVFEDLFYKLADKGVDVGWTDISNTYYYQMTENIKNKTRLT